VSLCIPCCVDGVFSVVRDNQDRQTTTKLSLQVRIPIVTICCIEAVVELDCEIYVSGLNVINCFSWRFL